MLFLSSLSFGQLDSLFYYGNYDALYSMLEERPDRSLWLAKISAREGDLDKATQYLEAFTGIQDVAIEAEVKNIEGFILLNKAQNELAESKLKAAQGLTHPKTLLHSEILTNLALVYLHTGNQNLAQRFFEQVLIDRKTLLPSGHPLIAAAYNNLGLVYSTSDPKKSITFYTKALELNKQTFGENDVQVAINNNNLALAHKAIEEYQEALRQAFYALSVLETSYPQGNKTTAFTLSLIGQIYEEQEDYILGEDYLKKAVAMYAKSLGEEHSELAHAYNLLSQLYRKEGFYDNALASVAKAFKSNKKDTQVLSVDVLVESHFIKGKILQDRYFKKYLKRQDLDASLNEFQSASLRISEIRHARVNEQDKIRLGQIAKQVYEEALYNLKELRETAWVPLNYNSQIFHFMEVSKSSVLRDAIADAKAKKFASLPDDVLQQEKQLDADIAYLEQQIAERPGEDALRTALFEKQKAFSEFTEKLEQDYPKYFDLKYKQDHPSLKDLFVLLHAETEVISYFHSESYGLLHVFYFQNGKVSFRSVPLDEEFESTIVGYRNSILYKVEDVFKDVSFKLFKTLFPKKPSGKELLIIPDGVLNTIPFESLLMSKKGEGYSEYDYLINSHALSYQVSTSLISEKQEVVKEVQALLVAPVEFEAFKLKALKYSEVEAKQVDSLFATSKFSADINLRSAASEELIKSIKIKEFTYLHLATHGVVDQKRPDLSRVYLSPSAQEDGILYIGEVYNLDLNAQLVTLSACETGLGKVSKGEGVIGLTRALLYAGVDNILVSYWTVNDESTAYLMIPFYDYLIKSGDIVQSLRAAKMKMIQSKEFAAPIYWAAFYMIGNNVK